MGIRKQEREAKRAGRWRRLGVGADSLRGGDGEKRAKPRYGQKVLVRQS
jgi:hypothetical protein